MSKNVLTIVLVSVLALPSQAQEERDRWVDSIFSKLGRREKVAQLFMVPIDSTEASEENALDLADDDIGSFFIMRSSPVRHARLVNKLQENTQVPLIIGVRAPRGAGEVIDSAYDLPPPILLQALSTDTLVRDWNQAMATQLRDLGVHINFAPPGEFGFEGLELSDARNVARQPGKVRPGETELQAFMGGASVLLSPKPEAAIKRINREVRRNAQLGTQLDASVRRVLRKKYDAGLNRYKPVNTDNLLMRLNDPEYYRITDMVSASAVAVIQNTDSMLPIRNLDTQSFVFLSVGNEKDNEFEQVLRKYISARAFNIIEAADTANIVVAPGEVLITGVFSKSELGKSLRAWLERLGASRPSVLVHFGDPAFLDSYSSYKALVAAYTEDNRMPSAAAQVIFGAIPARGKLALPTVNWTEGTSVKTESIQRLAYGAPESKGVSSGVLSRIHKIMDEAIVTGATPGCHTLVVKDGKVIYEQSAGYLTWEKTQPVTSETIYDLASLTKITATLQTVMFMHDHGLIDINKKASVYLPELKGSNKADFTLKDILTHQAGLWPFLPFWAQTMSENRWIHEFYSSSPSEAYPFQVSENLFASRTIKDSLWQWIIKSRVRDKPPRTPYDYRYSDMGFYMLQRLAEKLLNQPMEDFLAQNLYDPLGAYTIGYLPLQRFDRNRIAPTEHDTVFRKSTLVGYVHDQGAAMHGGVAGHAGLFGTATDLAKVGQMWLQRGSYGGVQYFKPETIDLFTTKQYADSRRGLGWDKPMPNDFTSPTTRFSSPRTYGHTGFTGTCIWVDPEFNLVYVFLSNRVMPDMNNNKLLTMNIRSRIQQVIYEAIFDYCATGK